MKPRAEPGGAPSLKKWVREKPGRARAVAFLAATGLVVLVLLAPLVTSGDSQLSAFDNDPRDASLFRQAVASTPEVEVRATVASPLLLSELSPERTTVFVIGVEKPFTASEAEALRAFVRNGGRLVLADDTGNANVILADLGILVLGRQLVDFENNYVPAGGEGDPRFPVAEARYFGKAYPLLFNQPSFITFEGTARGVVAESSTASFDRSGSEREIDIKAQPGPYPLVVDIPYDAGRILLVSDTGPFVDDVLRAAGTGGDAAAPYRNYEFIQDVTASFLREGGVAVIDESRHVQSASLAAPNAFLRGFALVTLTPALALAAVLVAALAVAAAVWRTRHAEDWRTHVFDVGHKRDLPEEITPSDARLRAMAGRAVSEKLNVSMEYLQTMSRDEVARRTGDGDLAAYLAGEARDSNLILQKLSRQE